MSVLGWQGWKLKKRICIASLYAECQAMAEALDNLNAVRLFFGELPVGRAPAALNVDLDVSLPVAPPATKKRKPAW